MKRRKHSQNKLKQRIAESDPERLNGYIEMFDRLLLYNMAAFMLPPEALDGLLDKWEETIKATINTESCMRTHFLESTPQGRAAKRQKQPDGEDLRLSFSKTLDTAKMILTQNLQNNDDDDNPYNSNIE